MRKLKKWVRKWLAAPVPFSMVVRGAVVLLLLYLAQLGDVYLVPWLHGR